MSTLYPSKPTEEPLCLQVRLLLRGAGNHAGPAGKKRIYFYQLVQRQRIAGVVGFSADIVTGDLILYAGWSSLPVYTVSFETNGGTTVASQGITEGGLVIEPNPPGKTGYSFAGWYSDIVLTDPWNFSADTVTENITLYANWTANAYTVILDMQEGTGGTVSVNAIYGSAMPAATAPVRTGLLLTDIIAAPTVQGPGITTVP